MDRQNINSNHPKQKRQPPDRLTFSTIIKEPGAKTVKNEIFCLNTLFPTYNVREITHLLLAFKAAISDPDTMYLHQVYKQQDWPQFQAAMQKEMEDQTENGNYSIILRSEIPQGHKVLPAVWAMKQKKRPTNKRGKTMESMSQPRWFQDAERDPL